jgi:hypothetical protein
MPFDSPVGSLRAVSFDSLTAGSLDSLSGVPFDSLSGGPFGSLRAGGFDEPGAGADLPSEVTPASTGLCHQVERHSKMLKGKGKRTPGQRAGPNV